MKKFFSFIQKLIAFFTLLGVAVYCIGYFFASKTRRINELFTRKDAAEEEE